MRELASAFSGKPNNELSDIDVVVAEGEGVYTRGYESVPGYFAFSRITPVMERDSNGDSVVRLEFECTEMSVAGGSKTLASKSVNIKPGKDLTFFLVTDEGIHNLVVQIGEEGQPSGIQMKVYNSYQTNKQ